MDYVIVGGGPSGLSLAYILAKHNYKVSLIEKDNLLGGSWKQEWVDKYFTENSPRVLGGVGCHMDFLYEIGMNETDFDSIYGNFIQTNLKIFQFIRDYFDIFDYCIFLIELIIYRFRSSNMVLQEWLDTSSLSSKAKQAIRIISITICDTPINTNLFDFFGSLSSGANLIQMKNPNQWVNILEDTFKQNSNISVFKNTKVISINSSQSKVTSVSCINQWKQFRINSNRIVLCTQSNGIYPILKQSNPYVQNNWNHIEWMKLWSENTFYSGFGFQLHFYENIPFPETWCWACKSEWTIIILPVSNWLTKPSKDPNIKTVWSCCIVDMDTKSKRLQKTPNECNKTEIINECLFQLNELSSMLPKQYIVTISPKIYRINNKWISNTTGFTRKELGYLPIRGKLNGLYAVGCFTKGDHNTIAYMKTAVEASKKFLNKYEPITKGFHTKTTVNIKVIIFIIVVFIIILFIKYL